MLITNWNPVAVIGVVALMVVVIAIGLLWGAFAIGFSSNGERIYFTGSNEGGVLITYRGGPAFGSPGMMMNTQLTCASCHGVDARGGIHTMHMQVMEAPDIRWSVLASEGGEENDEEGVPGDEHTDEHTGYDLEGFRLAVVEGKHPDGEVLSYNMPRWNIGDEDLADPAAFLKSPSSLEKGEKEMFPGGFSLGGWWIIFPIIGVVVMIIFMFIMMGRRGFMGPRRDSRREPRDSSGLESPLEILKKRYARGEISKKEYEGMKRDL